MPRTLQLSLQHGQDAHPRLPFYPLRHKIVIRSPTMTAATVYDARIEVNEQLAQRTFPTRYTHARLLPVFAEGVVGDDIQEFAVRRHTLPGLGRGDAAKSGIQPVTGGRAWLGRRRPWISRARKRGEQEKGQVSQNCIHVLGGVSDVRHRKDGH